jgi:hypothetical protein
MSTGIRIEFKVKKSVRMAVLYLRVFEKEEGLTKLTSLSEINPNKMLVTADVTITAYCTPCSIYMPFKLSPQAA